MRITSYVKITPQEIISNKQVPCFNGKGLSMLESVYEKLNLKYPKFYKMDLLCKLGFIASEILLQGDDDRFVEREDRAVVLCNATASFYDDSQYQSTIEDAENFYPSPSIFVYTLPNIVTGEIAIRNKYFGESSFYIMESFNAPEFLAILDETFMDSQTNSILCGWVEAPDEENLCAKIFLIERDNNKLDINELWRI